MDRLQDLDHPLGRATVEVVDVEDYPVDLGQVFWWLSFTVGLRIACRPDLAPGRLCLFSSLFSSLPRLVHEFRQALEVPANQRDDPQVLLIVGATGPLLDVLVQSPPSPDI